MGPRRTEVVSRTSSSHLFGEREPTRRGLEAKATAAHGGCVSRGGVGRRHMVAEQGDRIGRGEGGGSCGTCSEAARWRRAAVWAEVLRSVARAGSMKDLEQHFLKHNDAGSWIQDSAVMLSVNKEVPWYLDDGTGRVYVVGARGAAGLVLTVASEVFEESGRTLVRGTVDYLQGLKMLGVKRTERVLPTGTSLTLVGEAIKDDVGTIQIQ